MQNLIIAKQIIQDHIDSLTKIIKNNLNNEFSDIIELIYNTNGKIIISGIGKSGTIGKLISTKLSSIGVISNFIHATEAVHGDIGNVKEGDLLILLSASGETKECCDLLNIAKQFYKTKTLSVIGQKESFLGKNSDYTIVYDANLEKTQTLPVPSISLMCTAAIFDAIIFCLIKKRNVSKKEYGIFHPGGSLGKQMSSVSTLMRQNERIPLINENGTISEAIIEMSEKGMGIVGVVNNSNQLVGVISDGDLRRNLNSINLNNNVKNIMTHNPQYILPNELIINTIEKMQNNRILNLFVLENDLTKRIIGIVQLYDLM